MQARPSVRSIGYKVVHIDAIDKVTIVRYEIGLIARQSARTLQSALDPQRNILETHLRSSPDSTLLLPVLSTHRSHTLRFSRRSLCIPPAFAFADRVMPYNRPFLFERSSVILNDRYGTRND